jgi:hypothetical protein
MMVYMMCLSADFYIYDCKLQVQNSGAIYIFIYNIYTPIICRELSLGCLLYFDRTSCNQDTGNLHVQGWQLGWRWGKNKMQDIPARIVESDQARLPLFKMRRRQMKGFTSWMAYWK